MATYKSKKITKDGRAWFFRACYKDNFDCYQKYVSKKYKTKGEAQDEERAFLNKLNDTKNVPDKMTIGDLWDKWMEFKEGKTRISTMQGYKHTLIYIRSLFNIKCVDFSLQHYNNWRSDLEKRTNLNNVSKNDKQKTLRALLNWGRKQYDFNFFRITSMMVKFENPNEVAKDHEIYTLEDFEKFLSAEDSNRFRILWLTLYFCGLRIGEARGLQWKDIDWKNKTIWINHQVQSIDNYSATYFICKLKTPSSDRKLPMSDILYNEMKKYYNEARSFKNFSEDFFCFGDSYGIIPISYTKARRRKKIIALRAGIKEIRLHDFRHSCASLLIHKAVPIPMVSRYMGHASITETLNTYTHMFGTDLQSVASAIDNIKIEF